MLMMAAGFKIPATQMLVTNSHPRARYEIKTQLPAWFEVFAPIMRQIEVLRVLHGLQCAPELPIPGKLRQPDS